MPAHSQPSELWTTKRARVAGLVRRGASPERIDEARRELRAAVAEDYITDLVAQAPPLTPDQRARLAVLLLVPAGGSDG
jgi:hypothetical protein